MIDQIQDFSSAKDTALKRTDDEIQKILFTSFEVLSKKSPTNQEIAYCHTCIADMMKDERFFDILIKILIKFQDNPNYPHTPKLVITTFSTFLKHQQNRSQLAKKIDRHKLNAKLIQLFLRKDIKEQNRKLLIKPYGQFIYAPGMETIRGQTVDNICNIFGLMTTNLDVLFQTNNKFIYGQKFQAIVAYVPIAQVIIKGPVQQTHLKSIVKTFLNPMQLICLNLLKEIKAIIIMKNQPIFILMSDICEKMIQFLKQIVIGTSKEYVVKQTLMKDPCIKQIIIKSLHLSMQPSNDQNQINNLVIESYDNPILNRINQIKKSCIDIAVHFAKLCVSAQAKQNQITKQEYIMPLELGKYIIDQIPSILVKQFQSLNYPQKSLPHIGLYKSILNLLSNLVRILSLYKQSSKIRNMIFYSLCLPLLQRKHQSTLRSAQDYKSEREDILSMHRIDLLENSVCKLIQSYIDKIDGSILLFSTQIFHMIEFHLSANSNSFQNLPIQMTESIFFKETDYVVQIQCGLMVITLFSYLAPSRQDLIQIVQKLLSSRKQFFFNTQNTKTLRSTVLICYSYYVDNFYQNVISKKSTEKEFHLEVLSYCCKYAQTYEKSLGDQSLDKSDLLILQINAIQALDCISNCIEQGSFLSALFWREGGWAQNSQANFLNIFNFLLHQLNYPMNITVIEMMTMYYIEAIKSQCNKGFAIKRYHYEYKGVPLVIRSQLSNLISEKIYRLYNNQKIPNKDLMKCKIMQFLQTVLTCCEYPDQFLGHQFFSMNVQKGNQQDVMGPIDVFLRRMIVFKQQGRQVNNPILQNITKSVINVLPTIKQSYQMNSKLFGIIVSLITLNEQIIDQLCPVISKLLVDLLQQQDQTLNYCEQLEKVIQQVSYINMIAIYVRFSNANKQFWCILAENIEKFLANRSAKGIIAIKSSPYVGKLLTISLVCLLNMRSFINTAQNTKSVQLWANILRTSDIYITLTEKQIVSSIFIQLLSYKQKIETNDLQCIQCFILTSNVLYYAYSKIFNNLKNQDDEDNDSNSDSDSFSEDAKEQLITYKAYTIKSNEYSIKQKRDKYLIYFKDLCHKLMRESPDFIKETIKERLSQPIKNFIKDQILYFEDSQSNQKIRKIIKVKK